MPPKPFNPPRPNKSTSSSKISKPKSKSTTPKPRGRPKGSAFASSSKTKKPAAVSPTASDDNNSQSEPEQESDDPFASSPPAAEPKSGKRVQREEVELDDGEEVEEADERAKIPDDLLTKIIHEMFKEDKSRISKEANRAVGKYVDTFVREAVARVRFAGRGGEGGWWEVEDLEKMAPQLLLDF
ncbi:Centromere X protein [Rutstroemia sp. NJR-2017a WRK4]|nr:Centromere X protein [Rutstroemia sp. NJR-2017a WRK4]